MEYNDQSHHLVMSLTLIAPSNDECQWKLIFGIQVWEQYVNYIVKLSNFEIKWSFGNTNFFSIKKKKKDLLST
jgi:hypothetical protein